MNLSDYLKDSVPHLYLDEDEDVYKVEELSFDYSNNYYEGDELSKEDVMELFNEISSHASNNKYYVGITCNPDRRERDHKADFLAVVDCPSVEKANELEKEANKYGFDAGYAVGNAHNEDSTKVYIYKKTPKTIEHN